MTQASGAFPVAIPPAWRRWWRGQPRLALEDSPAAQIVGLTAMAPVERLLVLGPDAPALAALIADTAELQPTPIAALTDNRRPTEVDDVQVLRAEAHRLPLEDDCVDFVILPHQLRHWDDDRALRVLEELWRVLVHNGVVVLWEIAPSRSAAVNSVWSALLSRNGSQPRLRSFAQVGQLAYDAGFAWVQTLPLRPFLFPPGPAPGPCSRARSITPPRTSAAHRPIRRRASCLAHTSRPPAARLR